MVREGRLHVGDVVTAAVMNLREQVRTGPGKYRPVVVLDIRPSQLIVLGFTSQATYKTDGTVRDALPDWQSVPLRAPAYVFSWRPVFLPYEHMGTPIGRITPDQAAWIAERIIDPLHYFNPEKVRQ